jgi:hypothetical protein
MTGGEIVVLVASLGSILTIVANAVKGSKKIINHDLDERLSRIENMGKNNGGSSLKDGLDRLERAQEKQSLELHELRLGIQSLDIKLAKLEGVVEGWKS